MYNDNLLTSNLFLRYHLFLQENKSLIDEIEKNEDYEDYDDYTDSSFDSDGHCSQVRLCRQNGSR